jgi:hypothetical protein
MADENRYIMQNGNIWWYLECTPEEFLEDMISKIDCQNAHITRLMGTIEQQVEYMKSKGIHAENLGGELCREWPGGVKQWV